MELKKSPPKRGFYFSTPIYSNSSGEFVSIVPIFYRIITAFALLISFAEIGTRRRRNLAYSGIISLITVNANAVLSVRFSPPNSCIPAVIPANAGIHFYRQTPAFTSFFTKKCAFHFSNLTNLQFHGERNSFCVCCRVPFCCR